MMHAAPLNRNPYEEMIVEQDVLYFKLGGPDLVCFHGRNFNLKRRLGADRIALLCANPDFYKVAADTYVNLMKITDIENDQLYFGDKGPEGKTLPVSRKQQHAIREKLNR